MTQTGASDSKQAPSRDRGLTVMRFVVGRNIAVLDADKLRRRAAGYGRTVIDVGTGGGTALVRRARREPDTFFIGIDANAERMREASRRAARPEDRGGAPNTSFVAAAADELPGTLGASADEVTVVLPWGSLLHGMLAADAGMVDRLTGLLRADGRLEMLLSVAESDVAPGTPPLDEAGAGALAGRYSALGMAVEEVRLADESDVDRLGSSWGRRLGIPQRRDGWILTFSRR
jgi:16S rRNA (adenine(1408)-N(1))-methyltransferase